MLTLYTYFRSSAAYRVRIALSLKGLDYQSAPVHLVRDGGQQRQAAYLGKNPQGLVPALELPDGTVLTQSLAIMEYLEEAYPQQPLLPADALGRARVRALSQAIACDIHPVNNLRVLQYLQQQLHIDDAQKNAWYRHWISEGLGAVEALLARHPATGSFCHGDTPTLADCCLVPQVFNALRFGCPLDAFPTVRRIAEHCNTLAAFAQAAPARQPDAE